MISKFIIQMTDLYRREMEPTFGLFAEDSGNVNDGKVLLLFRVSIIWDRQKLATVGEEAS